MAHKSLVPDSEVLASLADVAAYIEAQATFVAEARKDRDALVCELAERGWSEVEIARAARITSERVHQIKSKGAKV